MRLNITRATLTLTVAAVVFIPRLVSSQQIILGVFEDNPGHYYGEPNFRSVRAVFKKVGADWQPFPGDCPDQHCLKTIASEYPAEMTWTIAFGGKNLGNITSRAPSEFTWYASVGQEEITSNGPAPTVGEKLPKFEGYIGAPIYRPLVANSKPYFKDPDDWKPFNATREMSDLLHHEFRRQFPKLCRLSGPDSTQVKPFPYAYKDVKVVKAYKSRDDRVVAQLHMEAVDCAGAEAGFDIDDSWFVISRQKSVEYLDAGMWLVDVGDYDNDGKSELVFSISRENRGGYEIFYDDFKKHATFEYSHH